MYKIYVAAIVIFFLAFPIHMRIDVYADIKAKKAYFALYLFRTIKVYGGYITFLRKAVAFHLSDRKALLIPYNSMMESGKKFEITKGFFVLQYRQVTEIGSPENAHLAILGAVMSQISAGVIAGLLAEKRGCKSCSGDVILREDESCLNFSAFASLLFNFAILLLAGSRLVLRKISEVINEKRKDRGESE